MVIQHRPQLEGILRARGLITHAAEVGVARGDFSAEILSWGFQKLYMVDIWRTSKVPGDGSSPQAWHDNNLAMCREKVAKYGEKAVFLIGPSDLQAAHVPDGSLGFVYLDACHDYEWVKRDLHAWMPKLCAGGIMAGHDYLAPEYGVKRAADEFAKQRGFDLQVIAESAPENASFWFFK